MDCQNVYFPFLPSVLFPSKLHNSRPTSTKCLSLGNIVMWSILWGWNEMQGVQPGKCLPLLCMFFAASLSDFRNFGPTTRVDCKRLSVPKGHCYQQSYKQNCHMTAQGFFYKNYTGRRNVNSSRTMLKLLIHGNKFSRFSTALTKHPTTEAQNAAM